MHSRSLPFFTVLLVHILVFFCDPDINCCLLSSFALQTSLPHVNAFSLAFDRFVSASLPFSTTSLVHILVFFECAQY